MSKLVITERLCKFVSHVLLPKAKERDMEITPLISNEDLMALLSLEENNIIDRSMSKRIVNSIINEKKSLNEILEQINIQSISDENLKYICNRIIKENENVVMDIKKGHRKAIGKLIGLAKSFEPCISGKKANQYFKEMIN